MKKMLLLALLVLVAVPSFAQKEVTICLSKHSCSNQYSPGMIGDYVKLCGGKCEGKTTQEMYNENWNLIQVVTGLDSSIGMIFERDAKEQTKKKK